MHVTRQTSGWLACVVAATGCTMSPVASNGQSTHVVPGGPVAPAAPRGADAADFVPPGRALVMRRDGDLDGNGTLDVLLVVGAVSGEQRALARRGLVIIRRDRSGSLQQATAALQAIPCERCGGILGDPLREIVVRSGGFSIELEGGSRELWSQEFDFRYAPDERTWRLAQVSSVVTDRLDGTTKRQTLDASGIGPITIENFDPDEFPAQ